MTVVLNQCFWLQWVVQTILMNWRDIHWGLKGGCLHWLTPQALPAHSTGCSVSCTSPNKTLCKIRHLASHFFFYKCYTNRSLPSPLKRWNVICIIYQSVWKAKKNVIRHKLSMLYEIDQIYIFFVTLISALQLLLKKGMFMRSCWLSRRSRAA